MSELDASPPHDMAAAETFCLYLAKQLIVNRGFEIGCVPEAEPIRAQSDVVLSFSDGYSLTIAALIDRELNPDKIFTLSPEELKRAVAGDPRPLAELRWARS